MIKENLNPYGEYPPYPFLEQVANHCHKATAIYLWLWRHKNEENKVTLDNKKIPYLTGHGTAQFNHNLLALAKESLINYDKKDHLTEIELVGWDDILE